MRLKLQHVAHVRSGDKGNTSNITVIAYEPDLYPLLKAQLTAERFKDFYSGMVTGPVLRYEVDHLGRAELRCARRPGRRRLAILCLDNYGKALSAAILAFELEVPDSLGNLLRNYQGEAA